MDETTQAVTKNPSPFAHIYKNRWRMAITSSVIINLALVSGMVWSFLQKPDLVPDRTPISINVVGDVGVSAGGPQVAAPQKSSVQPPAPMTEEQVEAIKSGVPVEQVIKQDAQPRTNTSSQSTNYSASQVGDPSGNSQGGASEGSAGNGSSEGTGGAEVATPHEPVVIGAEYLGPRTLPGSGNVVVYVMINEAGRAVEVDIISSSGNGSLDRWALQQARNSAYRPKTVDGEPVVSEARIEFGS
ncbi:TonB family protein [Veillonella intestinalis]|uniref:TonB family protein n=1 Tax=Veillonella intestinalis TaxID=2941341 RepID=UPI00203F073C|nr:TonB family protein [Veillonella intestinalis]